MARTRVQRLRSIGIQRTKRLPVGKIVYGARVTPTGKKKVKVYGRYEA